MKSKTYRLDRFINKHTRYSLADTRLLIAQKRILLDRQLASSIQQPVNEFTLVELDGERLQDNQPVYIMLNKPKAVVSATKDAQHKTVIDLISHPSKQSLHIVGRLDFNTTGLVLLTNDGNWSRRISLPESKLVKLYEVRTADPMNSAYISAFEQGIYFAYEGITTKPASLEILSDNKAKLSIVEGKYHQVKRMFGYFDNEVTALHRLAVGKLTLGGLALGNSRELSEQEAKAIF